MSCCNVDSVSCSRIFVSERCVCVLVIRKSDHELQEEERGGGKRTVGVCAASEDL